MKWYQGVLAVLILPFIAVGCGSGSGIEEGIGKDGDMAAATASMPKSQTSLKDIKKHPTATSGMPGEMPSSRSKSR